MSLRLTSFLLLLSVLGCQHAAKPAPGAATTEDRQLQQALDDAIAFNDESARTAVAMVVAEGKSGKIADVLASIDRAYEVSADNLVNADTVAFKAVRARCDGSKTPIIEPDMEQGALQNTGRPLDVAISGNGFFKVRVKDGFAYTRAGALFVNHNGELLIAHGDADALVPPITLPPGITDVSIAQNGDVTFLRPGSNSRVSAGRLPISQFMNPVGLMRLQNGLFAATAASGEPIESVPGEDGAGKPIQSFLEASNVNIHREQLRIAFLANWKRSILRAIEHADAR